MKNIFLLLLALLFISCENHYNKNLEGVWIIDNMTYLNQPCLDSYLVNMIDIDDTTLRIPTRVGYENYFKINKASWSVKKSKDRYLMKISSIDPIFNRTFLIQYDKVKYETAKLTLTSDSVKIYLTKTPDLE